jgi:hypothetical protein
VNLTPHSASVRLAVVGPPEIALHVPATDPRLRFVNLADVAAAAAVEELTPDVCLLCDPQEWPEALRLAQARAVNVAMITRPLASDDQLAALSSLATAGDGVDLFTWFEEPPPEVRHLPLLQVLPLPVDTDRCLSRPRLDRCRVLVPSWARPPRLALARLRSAAEVVEIPLDSSPAAWPRLLEESGAMVYWSRAALGRLDPLPLLALANGLLVVANTAFPASWGVELHDDYFVVAGEDELAKTIEEVVRRPHSAAAVRVRAWQKAREAFSARDVLRRLAHDALLFGKRERAR